MCENSKQARVRCASFHPPGKLQWLPLWRSRLASGVTGYWRASAGLHGRAYSPNRTNLVRNNVPSCTVYPRRSSRAMQCENVYAWRTLAFRVRVHVCTLISSVARRPATGVHWAGVYRCGTYGRAGRITRGFATAARTAGHDVRDRPPDTMIPSLLTLQGTLDDHRAHSNGVRTGKVAFPAAVTGNWRASAGLHWRVYSAHRSE